MSSETVPDARSEAKRDETVPEGRWEFDTEVTDAFDDMLARSIPQYEVMRAAVAEIATAFARGGELVDLGCSRGEALATVRDLAGDRFGGYVGLEVSAPMLAAARARFEGMDDVRIVRHDLREQLPLTLRPNVVLSVLTLQFVPIEYRQRVLDDSADRLGQHGALVLVEKVLGDGRTLDDLLVDRYYSMKRTNGYSQEAIDRKRLSLEGVLVPVTAAMNAELLRGAGFRHVDCFWRFLNFAAWVAVR